MRVFLNKRVHGIFSQQSGDFTSQVISSTETGLLQAFLWVNDSHKVGLNGEMCLFICPNLPPKRFGCCNPGLAQHVLSSSAMPTAPQSQPWLPHDMVIVTLTPQDMFVGF
jgi:hypothetical protein